MRTCCSGANHSVTRHFARWTDCLVELADNGFAGAAVVATARLLNACQLYDALAAHPDADLVLLLSDDVFRSTVAGGHTTLSTDDFTHVSVQVKEA